MIIKPVYMYSTYKDSCGYGKQQKHLEILRANENLRSALCS